MKWKSIFGLSCVLSIFKFSSSFFTFGLLARQITPDEYSVVPLAIALFAVCDMFCESGVGSVFNQYAISKEVELKILRRQVTISCSLYVFCTIFGYFYEAYFGVTGQFKYLLLSSIVFLFSPYYYIKIGVLRRLNEFKALHIIEFISIITSIVSFTICYLMEIGVYTIALSQLTMVIFRFLLILIYSQKAPNKTNEVSTITELSLILDKLTTMLKVSIFRTLSMNFEYYILPILLPAAHFSFISQGRKISQIPSDLISMMFNPPMQSFLRERQDWADYVPLLFLIIGLLVMILINLLSPYLIDIYLGEKWINVSNYLQLYSLIIPIFSINVVSGAFFVFKESLPKYLKLSKVNVFWLIFCILCSLALYDHYNFSYVLSFVLLYSLILPCCIYYIYNAKCKTNVRVCAWASMPIYYLAMTALLYVNNL